MVEASLQRLRTSLCETWGVLFNDRILQSQSGVFLSGNPNKFCGGIDFQKRGVRWSVQQVRETAMVEASLHAHHANLVVFDTPSPSKGYGEPV